jgi:Uma2 family endonuclease
MSVKQQLVTAEELWEMPDVPDRRIELVDGEVVQVSPAGAVHTKIMFMLAKTLDNFVSRNGLGEVMPDNLAFVLQRGPDRVRVPDVSFIAAAHVPAEGLPEGFWEGPPTLAVEVVSPHDRANDIHERVQDYLAAGTQQVWVLWPRTRSVTVYVVDGAPRELGPDAVLDGGEVLPGFTVQVSDLFEIR